MNDSKKAILVDGYIRELKQLLSDDTIIPNDIIALCQLFFINTNKLLIHVIHREGWKAHSYLLHVESKQIFELKSIESDKGQHKVMFLDQSFRHIQNINVNNKSYDGIICKEIIYAINTNVPPIDIKLYKGPALENQGRYLAVWLLEHDKSLQTIKYHKLLSDSPLNLPSSSHCMSAEKNEIILASKGELYQLRIQ